MPAVSPQQQEHRESETSDKYADHKRPQHNRVVVDSGEAVGVNDEACIVEGADGVEDPVPESAQDVAFNDGQPGYQHQSEDGLGDDAADHHGLDQ